MSIPRIATAPADKSPLRSRVANRPDIPSTDEAFHSLLSAGNVYTKHGQHIEAREVLRSALDIAIRRWWLMAEDRPDRHFLDTARLMIRMRACDAITKIQYGRIKQVLQRNERISTQMLDDLSQIALSIHDQAAQPSKPRRLMCPRCAIDVAVLYPADLPTTIRKLFPPSERGWFAVHGDCEMSRQPVVMEIMS